MESVLQSACIHAWSADMMADTNANALASLTSKKSFDQNSSFVKKDAPARARNRTRDLLAVKDALYH